MLDKIFKSNMIMGLVAITTLVLVGIMFWRAQKANENTGNPPVENTPTE